VNRYPEEVLDDQYDDDGTMPANVAELADAVVGHRIVSAEVGEVEGDWRRKTQGLILTLDNGKRVTLANSDDCCAYTQLEGFFLDPAAVDHMIMGVGTTDGYTTWHIYADFGDVMKLQVGWSCGNPFYYGYGFYIRVVDP
jgi:hypothetical protein